MKQVKAPHVPPCEGGEMSAEQQAVVDRYMERQSARDASVVTCPVGKRIMGIIQCTDQASQLPSEQHVTNKFR